MDTSCRQDLRDLFEANFGRMEARMVFWTGTMATVLAIVKL